MIINRSMCDDPRTVWAPAVCPVGADQRDVSCSLSVTLCTRGGEGTTISGRYDLPVGVKETKDMASSSGVLGLRC